MSTTRISLLNRIRDPRNSDGWTEFVEIYQPVIVAVIRSYRTAAADADDIFQEVLIQMSKTIRRFDLNSDKGKFRSYLRKVTANKVRDHLRKKKKLVAQIEQPSVIVGELQQNQIWDDELKRSIFRVAIQRTREHSNPTTWSCFQEHFVRKRNADVVAAELGITTNAVYINSSRTISRVKELSLRLKKEYDSEFRELSR